jgi:hypothetical protein
VAKKNQVQICLISPEDSGGDVTTHVVTKRFIISGFGRARDVRTLVIRPSANQPGNHPFVFSRRKKHNSVYVLQSTVNFL